MTIEEVRSVIDAITYKPGWTFTVERVNEPPGDWFVVKFAYETTDARPEQKGVVAHLVDRLRLPLSLVTEDILLNEVEQWLLRGERHEMQEWLRYRGKLLTDPHS